MPHDHCKFETIVQTYTLFDTLPAPGGTSIVAEWTVTPGTGNKITPRTGYSVKVSGFRGRAKRYSLLTLGMQSIDYPVDVTLSSVVATNPALPTTVGITDENGVAKGGNSPRWQLQPVTKVPSTVGLPHLHRNVPVEARIWFLDVANIDEVTFAISETTHPQCGFRRWKNDPPAGGHDNEPPVNPPA